MDCALIECRELDIGQLSCKLVSLWDVRVLRNGNGDRIRLQDALACGFVEDALYKTFNHCDARIVIRNLAVVHKCGIYGFTEAGFDPVRTNDDVDVFAACNLAFLRDGHAADFGIEVAVFRENVGFLG